MGSFVIPLFFEAPQEYQSHGMLLVAQVALILGGLKKSHFEVNCQSHEAA